MNMEFLRKLPIPMDIKAEYPVSPAAALAKEKRDREIADVFEGKSDRLILVIGPCSADSEEPVMEYIHRLRTLQDKVQEKLLIIPRIYTNKPRTTGEGYKGMLHQPDPNARPDMLAGLISIRKLHIRALTETGFGCADEMLYPENHRLLNDLLSYAAVGARSVENQQHRLTASGLNIPIGMKNPTGGDLSVMMNAIRAAQGSHTFIYRGWEVHSKGNPLSHAILRGYVDRMGRAHVNYHYEDLRELAELYAASGLANPAVLIDTNHSNSGKMWAEQPRIAKEIVRNASLNKDIFKILKGLMIESYIEDGAQKMDECIYGKSITDPCLGWEKTEKLILELADLR